MIPYGRHYLDEEDIASVVKVLHSDFLTGGEEVSLFEDALSKYVDANYSVACVNGTAALHLAAMAIGITSGDAVIVPSVTFLSTANAIRMTGAEVVFSDVDPESGLMRENDLKIALETARNSNLNVRAVFAVHLNGQCVDIEQLSSITESEGLELVIDASHAIGAYYQQDNSLRPVGSNGTVRMTTFSFHPVKTIAMGEGGAITTCDDQLAQRMIDLRNHGMTRDSSRFTLHEQAFDNNNQPNPWYYEMHDVGYNYRASDIHCALGRSQLKKIDRYIESRKKLAERYDYLLSEKLPIAKPIKRVQKCVPAWHLYPVHIDFAKAGMTRNHLMTNLREKGVGTQVHYLPVHRQPYYRNRYGVLDLPGADKYYSTIISLPLFPQLQEEEQNKVCDLLAKSFKF